MKNHQTILYPDKPERLLLTNLTFSQPLNFSTLANPGEVGMNLAGIERIHQVFDDMLARKLHPGAQLVVLRRGRVMVDRAEGLAHLGKRLPVQAETPFMTFSVSKAFTGMCVHHLIEQGKVELDAPIATYWPEFGCQGKETATIRHAFLHQAGIPIRGLYQQVLLWPSWQRVQRSVASLPAEFTPGSQTAYHLVNYGFILGEVVRRVSGLPVDQYLETHFLKPLGMPNTALHLPPAWQPRAARLYSGHASQRGAVFLFNLPVYRRALIPAASLQSTARELATFYQMLVNGGQYGGKRILKAETIAQATTPGYEGTDHLFKSHVRWALGFHVGGPPPSRGTSFQPYGKRSTNHTFGHAGQGSSIAWADPDHELVLAFTCNRLIYHEDASARWDALANAAWDAIED